MKKELSTINNPNTQPQRKLSLWRALLALVATASVLYGSFSYDICFFFFQAEDGIRGKGM